MLRYTVVALVLSGVCLAGENWLAGGAYIRPTYKPPVTGWFMYINETSERVWAIGQLEAIPVKAESGDPVIEVRYQGGSAVRLVDIGPVSLLGMGAIGGASTESYTAISGGGGILVSVSLGNWRLIVPVSFTNSSKSQYAITAGIGFAIKPSKVY